MAENRKPVAAYVEGRIRAGLSRAEIREELLAVGWSEEEADAAYRDGLIALGIPLPAAGNRPALARKSSAVDVVINFFSFIVLGIVAVALGTLYFQVINRHFPDPLAELAGMGDWASTRSIHYAIASLLIGFPLYYAAMRIWFRKYREDEGRIESRLSRWLTYIVLLVAAVTIVGDLIAVLFKLLQGETSVRFLLKALVILAIAGVIFGFYYLERRKIQYHRDIPQSVFRKIGGAVAGMVALGILLGFYAAGSPDSARKKAFDMERARHLGELSSCIERHAQDLGQLPESLDQLRKSGRYAYCAASIRDPESGSEYAYRIVTPLREAGSARLAEFELCAVFALDSASSRMREPYATSEVWQQHAAGRSCDTVSVQLVGKAAPEPPAALPQAGR